MNNSNAPSPRRATPSPRGFVTLSVMVVILLISYASYQFVAAAVSEHKNAVAYADRTQLELCADSAEQLALADLGRRRQQAPVLTVGNRRPADALVALSPAKRFANVAVGGEATSSRRARFTLVGRSLGTAGEERLQYGPTNESAKLSLSVLPEWERIRSGTGLAALTQLPGIDVEMARKIVAFLSNETGAAQQHWHGLALEELLQLEGMSQSLLFGADGNRNGVVSDWELASGGASAANGTPSNSVGRSAGKQHVPLASYLTPYSAERNVNRRGNPRIDVNMPNLAQLRNALAARLPPLWVEFIIAYREYGPMHRSTVAQTSGARTSGSRRSGSLHSIESLYDLVGAQVAIVRADGSTAMLQSPFFPDRSAYRDYLLELSDELTVDPRPVIPGRINVNLAQAEVLRAIPGVDDQVVERIAAARGQQSTELASGRYHASWLVVEGWIDLSWMRALEPYITSSGDVYRAQAVSFFAPGDEAENLAFDAETSPFVRREIVIDAARSTPRIISRHDLTNLGRGYALEALTP